MYPSWPRATNECRLQELQELDELEELQDFQGKKFQESPFGPWGPPRGLGQADPKEGVHLPQALAPSGAERKAPAAGAPRNYKEAQVPAS